MSFEHEAAAATRLVALSDLVEVIAPETVRARIVDAASAALRRYGAGHAGA